MGGNNVPDLTAIRQNRGVSLEQIARSTKICAFYLRAIEEGHLEKLPKGIYTKSYVRQYARAIDYDETELMNRYGISPDEGTETARPSASALERLGSFVTGLFGISSLISHARRTG